MSKNETVFLPNGQSLTVSPVFGGFFFESNDNNAHKSAFPAGWTIILQSGDCTCTANINNDNDTMTKARNGGSAADLPKASSMHRYQHPTLHDDSIFISSISNPSIIDYKPALSPTRATAMMLWASLYWYFQQPEPSPYLTTEASKDTPDEGKPRGDWRINIRRGGIFSGKYLLQKLERMGIIASEESYVGTNADESQEGWSRLFVSKRAFWQLSARLFLFTPTPTSEGSQHSRSSSPLRRVDNKPSGPSLVGPFTSGSHLPTYFPPAPLQYTSTNGIRHPIRPKPPRQGETFYVRYIKSIGEWLSFRVASISETPVAYDGPARDVKITDTTAMSDSQLLHKWMNDSRVSAFWGCSGPQETQIKFLEANLKSRHSIPVIGCWNGKPFGYFEVYWVKEDILAKHLNSWEVDDHDRGIHVLVGEQEYRGIHRLRCWISALAHYALIHDYRTNNVVLEPRVDNVRFIQHLENCGFQKEKEITFPHKQSAFVRLRRETFEGPAI